MRAFVTLAICAFLINDFARSDDTFTSKNFVYKYFMDKWPTGYICPRYNRLTRINVKGYYCIIGNSREMVFVVGK